MGRGGSDLVGLFINLEQYGREEQITAFYNALEAQRNKISS
jgi:hypothetical protein